jgi:hypothetical protein
MDIAIVLLHPVNETSAGPVTKLNACHQGAKDRRGNLGKDKRGIVGATENNVFNRVLVHPKTLRALVEKPRSSTTRSDNAPTTCVSATPATGRSDASTLSGSVLLGRAIALHWSGLASRGALPARDDRGGQMRYLIDVPRTTNSHFGPHTNGRLDRPVDLS